MGVYLLGILTGVLTTFLLVTWHRHARGGRTRSGGDREAVTRRMAEVAAMTAGLAHEIKNPLSTIGMNAQLLDEAIGDLHIDENEQTRIRRRIGTLTRETERLRGILTDFLEYAGELRLHRTQADLNEMLEELGDFFMPQAEKDNIRVRIETAGKAVRGWIDVSHVKQAVLNLMLNAAQAMADEQGDRPRELILRTAERKTEGRREVVIHVIDTGPGMSEAQRARVFEPYFTTKRGGSGLGLPTTRRIAEAHGGRLELVTEPGRGTDFAIVLPAEVEPGD